jgi:hypothetical protein
MLPMTTVCLFLAVTPVSTIAFDQIARAHASLGAAILTATASSSGQAPALTAKYSLSYRWPSELNIRSLDPKSGKLLRQRVIEPSRTVEYDPALMQYIASERPSGESLGATLANLDKDLDDLLLAFTAPEGMDVWLTDLVKLYPWKLSLRDARRSLAFKKDDHRISIEFDSKGSLVRKVDITTGGQRLVWTIDYAPSVGVVAFRPPAGATSVPVFDREMRPPRYADAEARTVAERMFRAYDSLRAIGFDVQRDSGKTRVQVAGKIVRQDDAVATWAYDGKRLTYLDKKSGRWYTGDLRFTEVVNAVGDLGTRVDPTARLLLSGFNPYRKRLGDGSVVKVVGTVRVGKEDVTILECESDNALVTLFVRKDGLVAGSSTRAKRATGDPDETVDLRYTYFELPKDAASGLRLKVPSGQRPLELEPVSN